MKKLFLILAMTVATTLISLAVFAMPPELGSEVTRDPDVPVPLQDPLPFPWATIEGVWEAKSNGINALFSFEVKDQSDRTQVLEVYHYEPGTMKVIASGTGFMTSSSHEIRAGMISPWGGYLLFVGLYQDSKALGGPKKFTIATFRSFNKPEENEVRVVIRKISDSPVKAPNAGGGTGTRVLR